MPVLVKVVKLRVFMAVSHHCDMLSLLHSWSNAQVAAQSNAAHASLGTGMSGPDCVWLAHIITACGWCYAGGGEVMRKWLRRVSAEHASLSASLPPAWTSSVFLAADPSRLDVLRYGC